MKKILLLGSNGMLGQRLLLKFKKVNSFELLTSSFEQKSYDDEIKYVRLDLSDLNSLSEFLNKNRFDFIINTAAFTAVDAAETEKELCRKINVDAVAIIANSVKNSDCQFINISSDYIYDGYNGPYKEDDPVNPLGYYGQSKLDGEMKILESGCRFCIIRTNVLYGPARFGRMDFVRWVVNSLRDNKTIKIVTDQINNPTYLDDLAGAILSITDKNKTGIYNIAGAELMDRFNFTLKIASYFDLDSSLIQPVLTSEFAQQARRPLKSGLITEKAAEEIGYIPTPMTETFRLMKEESGI